MDSQSSLSTYQQLQDSLWYLQSNQHQRLDSNGTRTCSTQLRLYKRHTCVRYWIRVAHLQRSHPTTIARTKRRRRLQWGHILLRVASKLSLLRSPCQQPRRLQQLFHEHEHDIITPTAIVSRLTIIRVVRSTVAQGSSNNPVLRIVRRKPQQPKPTRCRCYVLGRTFLYRP